jgi:hypothetical protein
MKNIYATLLAGTALLLAGATNAQKAGLGSAHARPMQAALGNAAAVGHPALSFDLRGGGPLNDECGSVSPETLASGGSLTFTGDNTAATAAGDAEAGTLLDVGGDTTTVWHAFTTDGCNDVAIAYCGTTTLPTSYWAILTTTCPANDDVVFFSTGNFTDCSDGNATIIWTALPAGTYYVPVRGEPSTAGPYTIVISATACPQAPGNDECASAMVLTSGTSCVGTPFSTTGATETLPAILCADFTSPNALDVWFSFVATNATQTIGVTGFDTSDPMVELFDGTCDAPNSLACADATYPMTEGEQTSEELIQAGLTVGNTYWVRVYDWGHADVASHEFEICVVEGEGSGIGMEENTIADFSLFPNPGTGVFNLQYSGKNGLANIEVLDVAGRIVYNKQAQVANGTTNSMDLTGLSSGNYNVRLTVGGVRTEQRLMVK